MFQTLPLEGIPGFGHHTPFMAKADGEEIGVRTTPLPNLNIQASLFEIEFASELVYDQDMGMDQAPRWRGLGPVSAASLGGAEHRPCRDESEVPDK